LSFISSIQTYWREILFAVVLLGMSAFWYYDRSSIIRAMDIAAERYEKELEIIKESAQREKERKEELLQEYRVKIYDLEKEYKKIEEEISLAKDERVEEIKKIRIKNPQKLIREIEQTFGFEYVE